MIRQKRPTQQYKLLQKEYDDVYKDIMLNGYDFSGPYTERCQEKLKEITGRKHMYMTISGTGAITAAIYALDLFDKKVAVGSWNYSACVNQYQAFSKPVFVDCDDNFFIDIEKIPSDCDAVMLVNYFGNVVDYDKLASVYKGKVVADCSQALGATYKGRTDGYFGDVSTFAFGGQKPLGTRGFAGAIGTDDDDIALFGKVNFGGVRCVGHLNGSFFCFRFGMWRCFASPIVQHTIFRFEFCLVPLTNI